MNMKIFVTALALAFAVPAAAQDAPAPETHQNHAQHQQHGQHQPGQQPGRHCCCCDGPAQRPADCCDEHEGHEAHGDRS
jgi:hypothetical protein